MLFSLAMLLVCIFAYNQGNSSNHSEKYIKTNFPTDSSGRLCGIDLPAYPYVYFAQAPEIVKLKLSLGKKSLRFFMPFLGR